MIARLDAIIERSGRASSALGIFPALYIVTTRRIKAGIEGGKMFEDRLNPADKVTPAENN